MPKVKLAAKCHVDKKVREAGEIVELPDEIAPHFGEVIVEKEETLESLSKMRKDAIIALAYTRGIETVPDSATIREIAELILAQKK